MDDLRWGFSPFGIQTRGFTAQDLPPQARQLLHERGMRRRYVRGEAVERRGVVPPHASWLLGGRLRCVTVQSDGAELHGGWIMAQEIFGVSSVILNQDSRMSMVADAAECEVLHFTSEVVRDMVLMLPDAGLGLAMGLSKRLRQQFDMIDVVGQRTVGGKLRSVLRWWATHHGIPARDGSIELWVGQAELAAGVGASRQRVHEELKRLRESGHIELAYRKVIVYPRFFDTLGEAATETA